MGMDTTLMAVAPGVGPYAAEDCEPLGRDGPVETDASRWVAKHGCDAAAAALAHHVAEHGHDELTGAIWDELLIDVDRV
jgi:hypothetical protein